MVLSRKTYFSMLIQEDRLSQRRNFLILREIGGKPLSDMGHLEPQKCTSRTDNTRLVGGPQGMLLLSTYDNRRQSSRNGFFTLVKKGVLVGKSQSTSLILEKRKPLYSYTRKIGNINCCIISLACHHSLVFDFKCLLIISPDFYTCFSKMFLIFWA